MSLNAFDLAYRPSLWQGLAIRHLETPVSKLRDALPDFQLRPLGRPPNDNPRLRLVVRMPEPHDPYERPVGSVSDRYDLLQHRVIASWLHDNAAEAGLGDLIASVDVTEYGERLRITLPLEGRARELYARDVYRPEIEITNSVD